MLKKSLSVLLSLILVLSVFAVLPASVSAENWGKLAISVFVDSPETYTGKVTGVKFYYTTPQGKEYTGTPYYTYRWLDENGNVLADNQNLLFYFPYEITGKRFTLEVTMSGFVYDQDASSGWTYSVNLSKVSHDDVIQSGFATDRKGKSVFKQTSWVYYNTTGEVLMRYTFEPAFLPVNQVNVNLPAPVAGEKPSFSPSLPEGTELYDYPIWSDLNESVILTGASPFKKGHTYAYDIHIKLKNFYYWADDAIFSINGNPVTGIPESGDKYMLSYKFPPAAAKKYNLWLGDTQVTDDNRGNILGDGKAKFDPATNTLTLNKATISGSHTGADGNAASIYAEGMDLTVKGSGTIVSNNAGTGLFVTDSDLNANRKLTLNGDFTFKGGYGVASTGTLTIDGGTITSTGTIMALGDVQVNAGLNKLEVNVSGEYGTFGSFAGQLTLDPSLKITLPAGGKVQNAAIVDASGQAANHIVITGKPVLLATPKLTKAQNAASGVSVTWGKVSGAKKYRVFRKSGSAGWAKLIDTAAASVVDKTAKSGTKYSYTVRCISADGKSYTSDYNKTGLSVLYLAQPKVTKLENVAKGTALTWSKSTGAASYNVYLQNGSSWKNLGSVKTNTYTYTKAKSGTTYTYTVRAVSKDGKTLSSYNTAGWKQKFIASPALPTLKNTKNGVQLTLTKVNGAEKYRIFRKEGSGKWAKLIDTTKLTALDKTAKNGKTYSYTVRCMTKDGSAYTSAYNATGKSIKCKR